MQKIKFTCPECGGHKLYAQREETTIHPLETVFDVYDNATDLSEWAEEKEYLQDSQIVAVFCEACGESIAEGEDGTTETTNNFLDIAWDEAKDWLTFVDMEE